MPSAYSSPCVGCQSIPRVKASDKLASEAREQLLAPPRHEIHLSRVDVPTAVREIQQTYDWTPGPDMNLERPTWDPVPTRPPMAFTEQGGRGDLPDAALSRPHLVRWGRRLYLCHPHGGGRRRILAWW